MKNCNAKQFKPDSKTRFVFVIIMDLFNLAFVFWGIVRKPNISNYFLFMFIGNLMVYFGYYCSMKIVNKESIPLVGKIVALLAIICVIPALYYFKGASAKSTNKTPAYSRNINRDCEISIYDTHDLWHFLSAGFLFFCYLFLLVLDDGIAHKDRTKIRVF